MNTYHREKKKMSNNQAPFFDRILASASYITFGTVGFIWLLFVYLTKHELKGYLRYHIFQSIFIAILYFIVSSIIGLIMQIFSVIPIINSVTTRIYFWLNMPIFYSFSIINSLISLILLYLVFTSLQGKLSYIPWVSEIIKANLRY